MRARLAAMLLTFAAFAAAAGPATAASPTLQQVDGGPGYYGKFNRGLPDDPSFFPVGVWGSYDHTQAHIDLDAAVENSPTVTSAWSTAGAVRALVKWDGKHLYVFAGATTTANTQFDWQMPCIGSGATAVKLGESSGAQSIPLDGSGKFTDQLADKNAMHIYRIDGGSDCGLDTNPNPAPTPPPTPTPIPPPTPTPSGCTDGRYQVSYFSDRDLTPPATDGGCESGPTLNHDWGHRSAPTGMPLDNWSARYTGTFDFAGGNYAFTLGSDDGSRLYVDNQPVIGQWVDQSYTTKAATKTLTAGKHDVRVEFYESGWDARLTLDIANGGPTPTPTPSSTPTPSPSPSPTPSPTPTPTPTPTPSPSGDLALNKPASASSEERADLAARFANDGDATTRWSSAYSVPQWWSVDLGSVRAIDRVQLDWEIAYATQYRIQTRTSTAKAWSTALTVSNTSAGQQTQTFPARDARYVRIYATAKGTPWGVSLWSARVCSNSCDGVQPGPTPTPTPSPTPTPTPTPSPTPTPTPVPGAAGYQTAGRYLLDPCGERVVVRGVEQLFANESWLSPNFVGEIAKTGANAVRIIPEIDGNQDGFSPMTLAQVEDLILRGVQGRMLVDVAINGGKDPNIYTRSDVKVLLHRWEKNIVIHAVGEASESTDSAWATRAKGVIANLRAAGYTAPLYIMSRDGGRNLPAILNEGASIVAADPLHNIVFGWQAYWGSSNYYQNKYGMTLAQAMQRVRDAPFPIQVGVLRTTDPNETMDYSPILADAQSYGIGWLWWDWRMSTDNLTTDGIYGHWAANGNDVAIANPNSLANTSARTNFQRNGRC